MPHPREEVKCKLQETSSKILVNGIEKDVLEVSRNQRVVIVCGKCGFERECLFSSLLKQKNPNGLCVHCKFSDEPIIINKQILNIFKDNKYGSRLLNQPQNINEEVIFSCGICSKHYIYKATNIIKNEGLCIYCTQNCNYKQYYISTKNNTEKAPCKSKIEEIKTHLKQCNSSPISIKYENNYIVVIFTCGMCKEEEKSKWRNLKKDKGICKSCLRKLNKDKVKFNGRTGTQKISEKEVDEILNAVGSVRITAYKNNKEKMTFRCGKCREEKEGRWQTLKNTGLCGQCSYQKKSIDEAKIYVKERGAKYLKYDWTNRLHKIYYECPECKEETSFTWNNRSYPEKLMCRDCRDKDSVKPYQETKEELEEYGFRLITTLNEYKGASNKLLKVECVCGEITKMTLKDVKKGRMCKFCKAERTLQTVLEKYGVENVSQLPEVKSKISEKIKIARSKEEVNEKIYKTCMERYGKIAASLTPENDDKKVKALIDKYGTQYPLQLNRIQKQIEEINLEKYGVRRPLQSNEIQEKVKETMMKFYGVEYAFQCEQISNKAAKILGILKEYIFQDGAKILVQGYEPYFIKYLELKGFTSNHIIVDRKIVNRFKYN